MRRRRKWRAWNDPLLGYRNDPEYKQQRQAALRESEAAAYELEQRWAAWWNQDPEKAVHLANSREVPTGRARPPEPLNPRRGKSRFLGASSGLGRSPREKTSPLAQRAQSPKAIDHFFSTAVHFRPTEILPDFSRRFAARLRRGRN